MLVAERGVHLTYCTNIHAGESWAEVQAALRNQVVAVKARISPNEPFGVGLRLSGRACAELEREPAGLRALRDELDERGLYVFTLNGFPFGAFHGTRVKEAVYRPDWLEPERVSYTGSLVRILAALLPEGLHGSISTVPGCFAPRGAEPTARATMVRNLCSALAELLRLERETGRVIRLALEPEPGCVLETTPDVLGFFEQDLLRRDALATLARDLAVSVSEAELRLRRHLGVCVDACHAAVEFEEPLDSVRALRAAGIVIPKIQVSAGLKLEVSTPETLQALAAFADSTYLHQVVVRAPNAETSGTRLLRFVDLPDAQAASPPLGAEWRVHFHVPVFEPALGPFSSTQDALFALLGAPEVSEFSEHWEVETYTFEVLPPAYRQLDVTDAIARELSWTLQQFRLQARA